MNANIKHKPLDKNLKFVDFTSYEALSKNPNMLQSLINDYRHIFAEPDVWNEQYSFDEILARLKRELDDHAAIRLCIDTQSDTVIGFCWAQVLHAHVISTAMQAVHFYKNHGSSIINESLLRIIGNEPIIYVQDLGVSSDFRGTVPLEQLICPVVDNVAQQAGTRNVFFWSVEDTCVGWLAQKVGIQSVMSVGRMQFFKGTFPSLDNLILNN